MTVILEAQSIQRSFQSGEILLPVLRGVDFQLQAGEFCAIAGSSGAGKSTLLHILGLLDKPDSGTILYQGKDITGLHPEDASQLRSLQFGFVFQFFHLLPEFSALENVLIPARLAYGGLEWLKRASTLHERGRELLREVGLGARMHHVPSQLSGGERQRVALARSLINDPKIVFCDEPTGNLDTRTAQDMLALLRRLNREQGRTFLIVTHDAKLAQEADRCLVMRDGVFVADGEPVSADTSQIAPVEVPAST